MTPIKFGTDGWRAIIADDFTYANLRRVTHATGLWLKDEAAAKGTEPTVMLGFDCRYAGADFARATANQLAQMGIKVFLSPGYVSTPMVSLATVQKQCTAGVILTASHNPPSYNGFKIKGFYGGPAFPSMIADVESRIPDTEVALAPDKFDELVASKQIEYYDAEALYINHLKQTLDIKLMVESGIKIGYDAMYGAGQRVMRKLFPHAELLHCDYNPGFDGQAPEPIEKNLKPFQALIREKGLQFGLATDGDADRIGLFDENGNFVDSHHILLLLIHYLVHYKKITGKVVTTFSASDRIHRLCRHYNLPLDITKIGFKYIGEIMVNEPVIVGGEESGGIAVAGHIPERDGIYIGLMLLEFMAQTGKSLTDLIAEVYALVGSFSFQREDLYLTEAKKQAALAACASGQWTSFGSLTVRGTASIDGYKFLFEDGESVLIRPSGTEPVLRVYAEAADPARAAELLSAVVNTVKAL